MNRETTFSRETRLWHPIVGWQTFPAGEQNPGPAWSETEGGPVDEGKRDAATLMEMAALTERAEKAETQLSGQQHDLAQSAQARADAEAQVQGLKRRAAEAEQALAEIEADKLRIAAERDAARQAETGVRAENTKLKAAKAEDAATIERIVGELNEANRLRAEEKARADTAEAEVAKMDPDKDGRIGGSKAKGPAKAG